jgi:hypothetical protein
LTIGQRVSIKNSNQKHHPTIGKKNHPSHIKLIKLHLSEKTKEFSYTYHFGVSFDQKT